jgi:formyltetrahydrofolate deformylase
MSSAFILTLSCTDRIGIVAAVATFLLDQRCSIVNSAQFGDPASQRFFMRVCFESDGALNTADLGSGFESVAARFGMQWALSDSAAKPRVLVMVSKLGHCLNDLLYRYRIGDLPIVIPGIVSNHADFEQLVVSHQIPFHHLPVDGASKERQERRLLEIVENERIELIVLARYMQILSPQVCARLTGRIINIHHSFLPSFRGARPYQQAHDRGVKMIGATSHYVTEDLDEGPIIEQDVVRVDHSYSVDACTAAGRDVESQVLARAVKWHVERRILLNGNRTVVFR